MRVFVPPLTRVGKRRGSPRGFHISRLVSFRGYRTVVLFIGGPAVFKPFHWWDLSVRREKTQQDKDIAPVDLLKSLPLSLVFSLLFFDINF